MRASAAGGGLTVHAVSGTHAVLLGFDVPPAALPTLLGFAVERTLLPDGAPEFLPNFLRFAVNDRPDGPFSTRENPLQAFQWGDYTVQPGQPIRYRVSMATGAPGHVVLSAPAVEVEVATEPSDDGQHGVWFNRGIAGSQAYARKFGGVSPLGVPDAQTWLSRGLGEALLDFIARAQGPDQALRGAFYEFSHRPVLDALRDAAVRGVDVSLVVADPADGRRWPISPACENADAIANTKGMSKGHPFVQLITARQASTGIAHNKFLVLLDHGHPQAVWTGSTNITPGAVWGHSNLGHLVEDPGIAADYLAFWEDLHTDPDNAASRAWVDAHSPVPAVADTPPFLPTGVRAVFSPHSHGDPIDRYVDLMRQARQAMFLTAPFGIAKELEPELAIDRGVARYLMLDKAGNDVRLTESDPSLEISVGAFLGQEGGYRQFVQERLTGLNPRVRFIHTKYLLIDPLTDHPVVITGSANFSMDSTTSNDENMLWISGNERVADIYLTEFMRLFTHFRFRGAVGAKRPDRPAPSPADPAIVTARHLDETFTWSAGFFTPGTAKARERLLFSGQL
jgi:phosphatidylserine/phosphatidylglycerophosphate/cardiolipin synthase-like enzyme